MPPLRCSGIAASSGEPSTSINVGRCGIGAMDRDAVAQIDELVLDAIQ
jgi:hypothetical protein